MNYNPWGLVVVAIAGGLLWWAVEHQGTLGDLLGGLGLAGATAVAAKSLPTVVTKGKGKTTDDNTSDPEPVKSPTTGDFEPIEVLEGA